MVDNYISTAWQPCPACGELVPYGCGHACSIPSQHLSITAGSITVSGSGFPTSITTATTARCSACGKPAVFGQWSLDANRYPHYACSERCRRWLDEEFAKGGGAREVLPDDPPGILTDLHALRERAQRVAERAEHKDLDGRTARLLAMDVLALCEALEEAYGDDED